MKKFYVVGLGLSALVSLVIGVIYFAVKAGSLPHFFPGYAAGSTHVHVKHGILFVALAVVLGVGAWIVSGPKAETATPANNDSAR